VGNRKLLRILALHPKAWSVGGYASMYGCDVRHVEIGDPVPMRWDGHRSFDGIGQRTTRCGIEKLLEAAREFAPHVILFGIHHELTRETLEAARRAAGGAKLVMHYTDQRVDVPKEVTKYDGSIDLLLLTNTDRADHAKYHQAGLKTEVLWDGVESREYHPTHEPAVCDAFFGGNNFAGLAESIRSAGMVVPAGIEFTGSLFRDRFLRSVADMCDLRIRGEHGWADWPNVEPPLYHPNYLAVLHQAKVILNTWNAPRCGLLTRRVWRSMASGRLFLTQYVAGMEDVFENDVHLSWFYSIEEGLDKLAWYLKHDDAREIVADCGARLIFREHTCEKRLAEFKKVLDRSDLI